MEIKLIAFILLLEVAIILSFENKGRPYLINLKCLIDGFDTDPTVNENIVLGQTKRTLDSDKISDEGISLIVNGQIAKRGQFPYQVGIIAMLNPLFGYLMCGGSLISRNYVLTAAHCLESDSPASSWLAVFGGLNLYKPEIGRVVRRFTRPDIVLHENFSSVEFQNDIALVRLTRAVDSSAFIAPIQLPTKAEALNINALVGNTAVISGWGRPADSTQNTSPVLRFGYGKVLDQPSCIQYYKSANYKASETQICAGIGPSKANSCNGDSGGPMVASTSTASTGKQIGIVSLGPTLCELDFPALNTRVGAFLNWIASNSDVKIS